MMYWNSTSRLLHRSAPVELTRSAPAMSTQCSELVSTLPPGADCRSVRMTAACERDEPECSPAPDLAAFMCVDRVVRFR